MDSDQELLRIQNFLTNSGQFPYLPPYLEEVGGVSELKEVSRPSDIASSIMPILGGSIEEVVIDGEYDVVMHN